MRRIMPDFSNGLYIIHRCLGPEAWSIVSWMDNNFVLAVHSTRQSFPRCILVPDYEIDRWLKQVSDSHKCLTRTQQFVN